MRTAATGTGSHDDDSHGAPLAIGSDIGNVPPYRRCLKGLSTSRISVGVGLLTLIGKIRLIGYKMIDVSSTGDVEINVTIVTINNHVLNYSNYTVPYPAQESPRKSLFSRYKARANDGHSSDDGYVNSI